MTNEELKKKIINLLDEATGSWYEDEDGMFAEGYSAEEGDNRFKAHVADALIAAGIGFKDKHRVFVQNAPLLPYNDDDVYFVPNTQPKITQLYSDEEVEQIVKERDEYKHRAEVAERALKDMCEEYEDNFECDLYKECNSDKPCYLCDYKVRLQKAAREIEEGKGK